MAVDLADLPFDENDHVIKIEPIELDINELKAKIAQLATTSEEEDLRYAMTDLKKALLANPIACAFLMPEDIGEMVKYIRRMSGKDIELQEAKMEKASIKKAKADVVKVKKLHELDLSAISDEDLL
jgi:hypothetical protein